jgi:MFS family permease
LGTLVGPMVAGGLMQHLSWQSTLQVYAVAIAALGLSAAFVLRGRPEDVGEYPDGLRPVEVASIPGSAFNGSVTLREAARQAQFWWFFIAIFFGSIGLFLALVHINPYAQQQGLNATQANLLIGLIGVGNIGGRLVLGRIGDRMGARRFLVIVTLSLALLCGFWSVAHSFTALAIFALLFGAANGGCIALYPAVASTWFGTANLGAILGALYIAVGIAAVGGGSAAGWLYDLYQSYTLSIALAGMAALLSALGIVLASRCTSRMG